MKNTNSEKKTIIAGRLLRSPELWCVLFLWIGMQCLFGTSFPYDYDSVNFALAIVDRFDPSHHQPQPPGYFFHVLCGKALHCALENPFRTQQVLNLIYLLLLVWVLVRIPAPPGIRIFLCTLPLLLFFTAVPVIAGALAGFSALLYWQIMLMTERKCAPAVVIGTYALAIGFRQDLSLFLFGLVVYGLAHYRPSLRQWMQMALIVFLISVLWLIPTWLSSSQQPFTSTGQTFHTFAAGSSIFFGAPPTEALRWAFRFIVYGFGVFGPAGTFYAVWCLIKASPRQKLILGLAVLPSLIFGLLVHGPKPGYWAIALGVFVVWSCSFIQLQWPLRTWILMATVNILFFLAIPSVHELQELSVGTRPIGYSIARQLAFVGANGQRQLGQVRQTMKIVDTMVADCDCFFVTDGSVEPRALDYLARHVWHNTMRSEPDSACCTGNTSSAMQ